MLELWLITCGFYALYTLCVFAIQAWQKRIMAEAQTGRAPRGLRTFRVCFIALSFAVVLLPFSAVWYFREAQPMRVRPTPGYPYRYVPPAPPLTVSQEAGRYYSAVAAYLVPFVLTFGYVMWRGQSGKLAGIQHTERSDREKLVQRVAQLRGLLVSAMLSPLACWMALQPPFGVVAPSFIPFIAGFVLLARLSKLAGRATVGKVFEFPEETPLLAELAAVARHFGQPQRFRVRVQKRDEAVHDEGAAAAQFAIEMHIWSRRFTPARIIFPVEVFRRVEPESITAILALRYANRHDLLPSKLGFLRRYGCGSVVSGAGLLFVLIFVSAFMMQVYRAVSIALIFLVFVGMIFLFFGIVISGILRTRRLYNRAYEAWRYAAPDETRAPENFVVALALLDRVLLYRLTPEALTAFIAANRGIRRFLKMYPGCHPDHVIRLVQERLMASSASTPTT